MVRSPAASGAAITGNGLPRCCRQSRPSRRHRGHRSPSAATCRIARTPSRGYAATREAAGLRLEVAARNERRKEGNYGGSLL